MANPAQLCTLGRPRSMADGRANKVAGERVRGCAALFQHRRHNILGDVIDVVASNAIQGRLGLCERFRQRHRICGRYRIMPWRLPLFQVRDQRDGILRPLVGHKLTTGRNTRANSVRDVIFM